MVCFEGVLLCGLVRCLMLCYIVFCCESSMNNGSSRCSRCLCMGWDYGGVCLWIWLLC